ncbi:MAG: hypothetical protein P9L98_05345 [Candidatus Kaelpia imicola]|nr:hypothetical protein [Candidatus Kaelpia imicola]
MKSVITYGTNTIYCLIKYKGDEIIAIVKKCLLSVCVIVFLLNLHSFFISKEISNSSVSQNSAYRRCRYFSNYPREQIIGITIRKKEALLWNYRNGNVPADLYEIIGRNLDVIINGGIEQIYNYFPINRINNNVAEHINVSFCNMLLNIVLQNEPDLNGNQRSALYGNIDSYLMTPEIKIAQLTEGEKTLSSSHIVAKPWGMEVWIAENDLFGIKAIYIMQGEHESVQWHMKKTESQLYFGHGEILHLLLDEFGNLREKVGLFHESDMEEVSSFFDSLPFVNIGGENLTIRNIPVGTVHTSRPTQGLIMHLEFNSGEEAAAPTVTTRLLDKYTDSERTIKEAQRLNINWWGPRLPVALGDDVARVEFSDAGREIQESIITEDDGVVRIETTPNYVIDQITFSNGESRNIGGRTRTSEVVLVLNGILNVIKEGQHYSLFPGEVLEIEKGESITLTSYDKCKIIHTYAP